MSGLLSARRRHATWKRALVALCLVAAFVAAPAEARRQKKKAPPPTPTLSSLRVQLMPVAGVAGGDAFVDGLKRALVNRGATVVIGPDGSVPDLIVDNVVSRGKVRVFGTAKGAELFSVNIKAKPKKTFMKGIIPVIEAIEAAAPKLQDKGGGAVADSGGGGGGGFDWNDPAGLKKAQQAKPDDTPAAPAADANDDDDDDDNEDKDESTPSATTNSPSPATAPEAAATPTPSGESAPFPLVELALLGGGASWSWSYAEAEGSATLPPQRATYLGGGLALTLRPLSFLVVSAGYDGSGVIFALPSGGGIVAEGEPGVSLQHRGHLVLGFETDLVDDGLLRVGGRLGYRLWLSDGADNAKLGELDLTFIPGFATHAPVVGGNVGSRVGPIRVDLVVDVAPYVLYSESPDDTGDAGLSLAAFGALAVAFDVTDNVFVAGAVDATYLRAESSGDGSRHGFIDDTVVLTAGGVVEQTRFGGGLGVGFRF